MATESDSILRRLLPFSSGALIIVLAYVGWIFYSRWQNRQQAEQKAAATESQQAQKFLNAVGSKVKIFALYADPGHIHPGETAQLCYGVLNAKTVEMDPKLDGVWPSQHRCVEVSPKTKTIYTLTATDSDGHSDKQMVTLEVR